MDESVHVGNNGPAPQKPPLSVGRIAGEILAGTATGCAAAGLAVLAILFVISASIARSCMPFEYLFACLGIALHGPGSAIGVYLVGSMGRQTGSFVSALGYGLLGGLVMLPLAAGAAALWSMLVGVEKVVVCSVVLLPPIAATVAFNATRRHRAAPSP